MRGVPLRVEIGPRDVEKGHVVVARRDIPDKSGKQFVVWDALNERIVALLDEIQAGLFARAKQRRAEWTRTVASYDEFKASIPDAGGFGFVRAYWAGTGEDEDFVKKETGATIRAFPFDQPAEPGKCFLTGRETSRVALFARAY